MLIFLAKPFFILRLLIIFMLSCLLFSCGSKPIFYGEDFEPVTKDMPLPIRLIEGIATIPLAVAEMTVRGAVGVTKNLATNIGTSTFQAMGLKIKRKIHGNWCGPGYPQLGESPPWIDEVDKACMVHDKCYQKRGYYDCRCDVELQKNLAQIKDSNPGEFPDVGHLVMDYFSNSACEGCKSSKYDFAAQWCYHPDKFEKLDCEWDSDGEGSSWCPKQPIDHHRCERADGQIVRLYPDQWTVLQRTRGEMVLIPQEIIGCLSVYADGKAEKFCGEKRDDFIVDKLISFAPQREGDMCIRGFKLFRRCRDCRTKSSATKTIE